MDASSSCLLRTLATTPRRRFLQRELVNQDKVFTVAGQIGTATNMAAMPIQFSKNVINWFPITAAREMYEPFHRLKYSFAATYYDQIRLGLPTLMDKTSAKKVCAIYQDDEFGLEVLRGAESSIENPKSGAGGKNFFQARCY